MNPEPRSDFAADLSTKRRQTTCSAPDHSGQARALLAPAPAFQLVQRISPGHLAALQDVLAPKGDRDRGLCPVLSVQGTSFAVLWLPGWAGAVRRLALPLLVGCLVPWLGLGLSRGLGRGLGLGLGDNGFPLGLECCDASLPVCRRTRREMGLTSQAVRVLIELVAAGSGLGLGWGLGAMGCRSTWSAPYDSLLFCKQPGSEQAAGLKP